MSISKILKYARLKSELSADELKQAEWLVAMTESDRLAVIELWGMKSKPATKPATKRVIEHCVACDYTKRAAVHKDLNANGYHVFQSSKQTMTVADAEAKKSARASSLSRVIKGTAGGTAGIVALHNPMCVECGEINDHANHDLDNGGHEFEVSVAARAVKVLEKYESDDGACTFEGCTRPADDNVHHLATHSYYHEFQPATAQAASGG